MNFSFIKPHLSGAVVASLLFAGVTVRADYQSTVVSQRPAGFWRLNETAQPPPLPIFATNIGSLGLAGNGTYYGVRRGVVPGAIASQPANAAAGFDGVTVSNRVRVPFQSQWNPSGPLTVEFWAKPGQTNTFLCPAASVEFIEPVAQSQTPARQRNGWLIYQSDSGLTNGNGWVFFQYNSKSLTNFSIASADMTVDTNRWYHIAGVYDGSQISIYVNGVLGGTAPFDGTPRPNTNTAVPLTFGARADGQFGYFPYAGLIDETAVYDAALSPARILAHYQAGTNAAPPTPYNQVVLADAPVGYWRFGEPADPPAANLGTLGPAATGSYVYNAAPGVDGPRPPSYPGFEAGNTSVGFDGVGGGYVSVPALNLNTNTVTITGWFNAAGGQNPGTPLILNRSGDTTAGITMDIGGGLALSYNWANDPATFNWASSLSLADSDWSYVALVIQPTQAALYTASAADASTWLGATNHATHQTQAFEGPTLFGADFQTNNTLLFNGSMDEVAIFNRSLSEGELYSAYATAVGGVAPQLFNDVSGPADQPFVGATLNLAVDVGGTPSLSYQWRKDGAPIGGATGSSFSIASLSSSDSGSYDVVVTNAFGQVLSGAAVIAVQSATTPVINQGPVGRTLYPGGLLDLTVDASGGELHYQWQKAGTNLPGATASAYVVNSVSAADGGVYRVTVSNSVATASAGPVVVNVVVPPTNSYEATIVADSPEAWWRLDEPVGSSTMFDAMGRHDGTYVGSGITLGSPGAIANGATNTAATFDGTDGFGDVPYSSDLNTSDFTIEAWAFITDESLPRAVISTYDTTSHRGIFFKANPDATWETDVGLSDAAIWYFIPTGPIASGRWSYLAATFSSAGEFEYIDGQQVAGPYINFSHNKKFDFLIGAVGTNWQGIARWKGAIDEVAVYKYGLSPQQIQNHYVQGLYGNSTKPIFVTQPQSVVLASGDLATFSTKVEGSLPLKYQWLKDGLALPGATTGSLTFTNLKFSDTGAYRLAASNPAGTNLSNVASLTVLPPITFANATNGLVLHLKFDGDYVDASGRGNNGTPVGTPAFVAGKIGQALHYSTDTDGNGTNATVTNANYVTLGTPQDLLFGASNSFSVAFWVREEADSTNGDLPFLSSAINSANSPGFTFAPSFQHGGWQWSLVQVVGTVTNDIDVNGPDGSINSGGWHHFAATFDRNQALALTYLDGVQVDSTSLTGLGSFDTTNTISIGQGPTGNYPQAGAADLDDLGVWRRVLSPLEIYEIYYSGAHSGAALDANGRVSLAVSTSGSGTVLIWQVGTLLQADTPLGPWSPVAGANSPSYIITPGAAAKFYRVKQ
ncbi:MAG TPA: LamG-like jellyroll fold domain-containing protein [Verrucomicrobiae bacterium]|nr:LamG-like jellyroll fold domain-containing protein [Verrucomicrobiae bacterium]